MENYLGFRPSINLHKVALRYLRLLDRIHIRRRHTGQTGKDNEKDDILKNAVYRYEKFWLPLLSSTDTDSTDLTPPWDVYYAWCLHILTSFHYRDFCREKYGKLFNHKFHEIGPEEDETIEKAKQIWKSKYDEPYDLDLQNNGDKGLPSSELLDLISKCEEKQDTFYYQVCMSHYRDDRFLDDANDRYCNLLLLKQNHPSSDLCPTYDTELIRQAHVLHPLEYETDLKSFLGDVLDFETLDHAFDRVTSYDFEQKDTLETTRRLWSVSFASDYDIAGAKHRGHHEISSKLSQPSKLHLKQTEPETLSITLDDILVSDLWSHDKNLSIEFRKLGQTSSSYNTLFRISGKRGEKMTTKNQAHKGKFEFNLRKNRGIELHILGTAGRCFVKSETHVATVFLDPRAFFDDDEPIRSKQMFYEVPRVSYGDPTLSFDCEITVDDRVKSFVFSLDRSNFVPSDIPEDLKPFTKIEAWNEMDLFAMDTFSAAKHGVPLLGGNLTYTCNVVCCRDFDLGAILLYENDTDLLTVAQTIGNDQLPLPRQVSTDHMMSLDKTEGENAMLVRNKDGDWGACIIKPVRDSVDGSVQVLFEHLQKHYIRETTFTFEESTLLRIDGMVVDLFTGRITLQPMCEETAEYVTLAYVIGTLLVFTTGNQVLTLGDTNKHLNGNVHLSNGVHNSRTAVARIKAKSGKKYEIGGTQSVRSSVTLSNLKSRRKKRSLVCTMLLACGLKSNMMVEEDLKTMSFHSEVSLLSADDAKDSLSPSRGMDDVHRHSFYHTLQETSKDLSSFDAFATLSSFPMRNTSSNDQVSYGTRGGLERKKSDARRKISESLVPRSSIVSDSVDGESYEIPDFLSEAFFKERARKIVDGAIAGVVTSMETGNDEGIVNKGFISEGDELEPTSIIYTENKILIEEISETHDTRL